MPTPRVARIWQGRTHDSVAKEYLAYMHEHGVKKILATKGNLGVQVFQRVSKGVAYFMTISYWSSRDEIRAYAGADISKPHHLDNDPEYLLELPTEVQHFDIAAHEDQTP